MICRHLLVRLRHRFALVVALLGLSGLASPMRAAWAQSNDASFDVQLLQPGIGPRPFLTIDGAEVVGHRQFALSLMTSYQNRPFSLKEAMTGRKIDIVRNQVTTELVGAFGFLDRFQIGLGVPIHAYVNGDAVTPAGMPTGGDLSGGGLGDLRVEGKILAVGPGLGQGFSLSVAPGLTLPTGNDGKYQGDKTLTGRLRAIAEFRAETVRAAAMVGGLFRDESRVFGAVVGPQLLYGVGGEVKVHRDVGLIAEIFGRSGLSDFGELYEDANPAEADLGMRVALPRAVSLTLGGGLGFNRGIGSPRFRGFLLATWAPDLRDADGDGVSDSADRCAGQAEDLDGYRDGDGCPDPDNDLDNVPDAQDRCPTDPEDIDQHQDEDGCPEADNDGDGTPDLHDPCPNAAEDGRGKRPKDGCPSSAEDGDGDGVADGKDQCAEEPEDRDGFQDGDGCPDPDNDEDNIPDQFDGCPDGAEDIDDFEDSDGCPDPDNDKDGIEDKLDRCPKQAETLNGSRDQDGCPDPGAELLQLRDDRIELRDKGASLAAGGNRPTLSAGAQTVINLLAMVLKGHPEIATLRIEVSGQGVSPDVSQARAEAIVGALVSKGIDAGRLKAVGAGAGANQVDLVIESRVEPRKATPAPAAPASP
jgi:OmpA-OmpF porin, OOP family